MSSVTSTTSTVQVDVLLLMQALQLGSKSRISLLLSGLSLVALVEAIVLHDRVSIAFPDGHWTNEKKLATSGRSLPLGLRDLDGDAFVGPLIQAGLLEIVAVDRLTYRERAFSLLPAQERLTDLENALRCSCGKVHGESVEAVAWSLYQVHLAESNSTSFVPSLSREADIVDAMLNAPTNPPSLLHDKYHEFSNELLEGIRRLSRARHVRTLLVPPIAAVVLGRAHGYDDIGSVVADLHSEFAETRKRFGEYEAMIRDESQPIGAALAALDRVEESLREAMTVQPYKNVMHVSEWSDVGGLMSSVLDGLEMKDAGSVTGFLMKQPAKKASQLLKRRRAGYFTALQAEFLRITNYASLLQSRFGREIDARDIDEARRGLSKRAVAALDDF